MGKVSLCCKFFFLSLTLLQIQFHSLPFDLHETQVLRPERVDVSDNSWIPQVEESVINGDAASGRGVKNGEFRVFDSSSEEVGDRICSSVKRDGVEGRIFRSSPLKVYSIADVMVSDVLCDFFFIFLINEDEGVVFWVSRIV